MLGLELGYLKFTAQIAAAFPTPIFSLPPFLYFAYIMSIFCCLSISMTSSLYPSTFLFRSRLTVIFFTRRFL